MHLFMCFFKFPLQPNFFSHTAHVNSLIFSWTSLVCLLKLCLVAVAYSHNEHLKSFFFSCTAFMCFVTLPFFFEVYSQCEQEWFLSLGMLHSFCHLFNPCRRIHWIQCALSLNYLEFTKSRFSTSRKHILKFKVNLKFFVVWIGNWYTGHNQNYRSMSLGPAGPNRLPQVASSKYQNGTTVTTVNIR